MSYPPEVLKARGLTPQEYDLITDQLGRDPNPNELAMFGVMWSEHCCYKNSRPLLKLFPTAGPRILVGPGENAGVVDIGDGDRLVFKIESHNHPSAVEPFQGAATGVGGILRDIFTMGARPIALLNALRFGDPHVPATQRLLAGVVSGISHYGNCTGIPTIGGEVAFAPCYQGNPLVNVMALGLLETPHIVKSGAQGVGNPVVYVGSTTGRDGMGGASFASAELSAASQQDRPAVQVGDPFLGKCLIEACLEAFHTGAVVAAQDMGAAGITCSVSEMATKGGTGIYFDLDRVPVRAKGMQAWEFLLSESQERMLFVIEAGREQEIMTIFHRWGLQAVVAGEITADGLVTIDYQGQRVVQMPATALTENTPVYPRPVLSQPPAYVQAAWAWDPTTLPEEADWGVALCQLLSSPTIASKRAIYRQYDHQVHNNSVLLPGQGDAGVIRIRSQGGRKGIAATVDGNSRWVYLDPYEGGKAAVAEAARNLSCVGAEPLAVTDNLNFGNPENPVVYWQLAEACRGIAAACQVLETPVTGGNVSLYNETLSESGSQAIYPTPVIGMVGLIPDITYVCGAGWVCAGDLLYLLGSPRVSLGGSEYLWLKQHLVGGRPTPIDLALEKQIQGQCRFGIRQGWIRTAHDCSEGGLAVAIAESCILGQLGATITLPAQPDTLAASLFGEGGSRIVVAIDPQHQGLWEASLGQFTIPWTPLGTTGGDTLTFRRDGTVIAVTLRELETAYFSLAV